jgi:hypothetical protein
MLRRISRLAFRLPKDFDEPKKPAATRAYGIRSARRAIIGIDENLSSEGESVTRRTDIVVERSADDPTLLTGLTVDRYVDDEVGALHGAAHQHETFAPGATSNDLSLFQVMRCVGLAVRTVEDAKTIDYFSRPMSGGDYPQTF